MGQSGNIESNINRSLANANIIDLLEETFVAVSIFMIFSFNYDVLGIGYVLTNVSMIIFICVEVLAVISRGRFESHSCVIFILLFSLFCLASVLWSTVPSRSMSKAQTMLIMALWLVCLTNFVLVKDKRAKRVGYFAKVIVISSIFASCYLLVNSQWILGIRANGIIGNSNQAGAYIAYSMPAGLFCAQKKTLPKSIVIIQSITTTCATIVGGSRTVLLVLTLGYIVYWVLKSRAEKKLVSAKNITIVIMFLITTIFLYNFIMTNSIAYEILGRRIQSFFEILNGQQSNTNEGSYYNRILLWNLAAELWRESPLVGLGIDTFPHYAAMVYQEAFSHNNYIELLEGVGIIGFTLYYMSYFILLRRVKKVTDSATIAVVISILIQMLISHITVVFYYQKLEFVFLALLVGLVSAGGEIAHSKTAKLDALE